MAKVKRKKDMQQVSELPTLAQSIETREMMMEAAKPGIPSAEKVPMEPVPRAMKVPMEPVPRAMKVPMEPVPRAMKVPMEPIGTTTKYEPGIPSQSKSAKVKRSKSAKANIYDESIGYGEAMKTKDDKWAETGREAVERIKKARVKRKGM
jgi:hypothetical protein